MSAEPPASVLSLRERDVLVTGATGFIGTRLVEKLIDDHGATVTAAVRSSARAAKIVSAGARAVEVNLNRYRDVEQALAGHDTVFHVAHDFKRSAGYNLKVFKNLADACAIHGVRRLVYVSSIAVYDDWPKGDLTEDSSSAGAGGDYKNAKMAVEVELRRRVEAKTLDGVIVQPTIVYGPKGWMWTDRVAEQLMTGTVVLPDDAEGLCSAVYVDDVAGALIQAATGPDLAGEAFIVSGPDSITWRAFFEAYAAALGVDAIDYVDLPSTEEAEESGGGPLKTIIRNPMAIANWWPAQKALNGLRALAGDIAIERLRALVVSLRGRTGPVVYYPDAGDIALYRSAGKCSIEKARQRLGYSPAFDFAAGFERTADYLKSEYLETR